MQEIASHQESAQSSTVRIEAVGRTRRALSGADLAVMVAIPAPMAIFGLLVLFGFGVAAAAIITVLLVFAVTMTMDVRSWLRDRRHRSRKDLGGSGS
ncbi:MAG: hypothetical protein JWN62_277 [Acidimicrobiales bacterium]|nr:hypothetical protein [Acidimicrobiales bacterium]